MRPKKSVDLKSLPIIIGIHNRMVNDLRYKQKRTNIWLKDRTYLMKDYYIRLLYHLVHDIF